MSFTKEYWDKNYYDPKSMDGIGNAKSHAKYLKSFLELEQVDISSIIDFGFGYGYLFQEMMKAFLPYKAYELEPSEYAFKKASKRKLKPVESTELELKCETIQKWCERKDGPKSRFDLGLCNSVLQYIPDNELPFILETIARRVKYLYLSVPTDIELKRQREEVDFHDSYALKRSYDFYYRILSKNFTFISSKFLESKYYFNKETTLFTDLLFRF